MKMKTDSAYENEVPTLNKPVLVLDDSSPVSIFVMVKKPSPSVVEDFPTVDLSIRQYVSMDALSKELVQSIRQAIQGK